MNNNSRFLGALVVALAVFALGDCGKAGVETPTGSATPAPTPTPAEAVAPDPAPTSGTPANNGLKVEIIRDEWDGGWGGSCHKSGGTRTLRLTNTGTVHRYSNLSAFSDDVPRCATQKKPTGKPGWTTTCPIDTNGRPTIAPGQTCEYSIQVRFPAGTDGVCTLQVDDTWGPGGVRSGAFVVGDSFKVPDAKCAKVCEDPDVWKEKPGSRKTVEGAWGECGEVAAQTTEQCYECRTVTTTWVETNCDNERPASKTKTERREIECDCVEWAEPKIVCGEWNECHEHPGAEQCYREKECTKTWNCKDPEPYEESETCPCVCQDNPKGSVTAATGGNPYRASATFEDSGEWVLRISASSRESECTGNRPDYWKRTVRKTLECDERGAIDTSYSWAGHRAEWWRAVLYRNGQVVDQTACVRNPYN